MKKMTGKNTLMLFLTAFIWGTAFVAQSVGMDYIGPFTFTCVRSLIGGIFLIPCICFLDKWRAKNDGAERQKKADRKEEKKNVILGGICCGLALCVASNLQQIGIQYTTVGKAGFITYRACADFWNFSEKESRSENLDKRGNFCRRLVFAVYYR